jgi:hypothetical protein
MQLKFSDAAGTTLDVLAVNGNPIVFQGATRDSLEIQIAKDKITFDALDKLTITQTNTAHLTLIDGDKQYVHDNYSLRASLALKPVVTTPATSTAPAVTEDRLCLTLTQKAYQEQQVEQLQSSVDALTLSALGAK